MQLTAPINTIPEKLIYLIHGGEIWQTNDVIDRINKNYAKFDNLKKYYFTNFVEFEQFKKQHQAELCNLDLFCEHKINKLIKINIGNGKLNKSQQEELIKLIQISEQKLNFILILVADKLEKTIFSTAWFAKVNQIGVIIMTKALSAYSMKKWTIEQFAKVNLQITDDALTKFLAIRQNNLLEAFQDIYKLSLSYNNSQEITLEILLDFMLDNSVFSVFDLQNALASKNIDQIIYVLNTLKTNDQEVILVLWLITKEIRKTQYPYKLLQKAAEIDLAIKTFSNNKEYIWMLIIELCILFK